MDGNTPLHEWSYPLADRPQEITDEAGIRSRDREEPTPNLTTTWVFEEGTFRPAAKITEDNAYSIITDYLGTPVEMYGQDGKKTWQACLDIYGKVANFEGRALSDCPFRYQGQYEDEETGLYYNRFRYYSPDEGMYLSQDPIGLAGNNPTLYGYVKDVNSWVDEFGLRSGGSYWTVRHSNIGGQVHHTPANAINGLSPEKGHSIWMSTADHKKMRSFGSSTNATLYRAQQASLISQGRFSDAIEMDIDIDDIRGKFGSTYDDSLKEMLDYAENEKLISKADAARLKIKCH